MPNLKKFFQRTKHLPPTPYLVLCLTLLLVNCHSYCQSISLTFVSIALIIFYHIRYFLHFAVLSCYNRFSKYLSDFSAHYGHLCPETGFYMLYHYFSVIYAFATHLTDFFATVNLLFILYSIPTTLLTTTPFVPFTTLCLWLLLVSYIIRFHLW